MGLIWRKNLLLQGDRVGKSAEQEFGEGNPQNQDPEGVLRLLRKGDWDKQMWKPGWATRVLKKCV